MSTVMRPTGPLPPRVYWTRRLVLVVVLVLVATGAWWLVGGSGGADDANASASSGRSPRSAASTTPADDGSTVHSNPPPQHHAGTPTHSRHTEQTSSDDPRKQPSHSKPSRLRRTPPAEPTGDCKPGDVDMTIDVGDSTSGRPNTATLLLNSLGPPACTLSITPDTMTIRITSGDDVVWSSDDCPDALLARQLVARNDPPTAYTFRWDGRRSADNCQPVSSVPQPGGYWVEAAMIGGEPHKAYFDIKSATRG